MTSPTPARSRGPLKILALVIGGIVGVALAAAAVIGVGFLFWLLLREMAVAIGRAIVEAVSGGS